MQTTTTAETTIKLFSLLFNRYNHKKRDRHKIIFVIRYNHKIIFVIIEAERQQQTQPQEKRQP